MMMPPDGPEHEMSHKLIHVVRSRPAWATGAPLTVCGNRSHESDLTTAEMQTYIKKNCRGSEHVAYGSCCVTCLRNWKNSRWQYRHSGAVVGELVDHLQRTTDRSDDAQALRKEAEVLALNEVLRIHADEFEALVERHILRNSAPALKAVRGSRARTQ